MMSTTYTLAIYQISLKQKTVPVKQVLEDMTSGLSNIDMASVVFAVGSQTNLTDR